MDTKRVAKLVNMNKTAKAMFRVFLERDREPREGMMDTRRVRYDLDKLGVTYDQLDVITTFEEMQKAGVGKLVKKGGVAYFKWAGSMKEIVTNVLGGTPTGAAPAPITQSATRAESLFDILTSLPKSLTQKEAQFLCQMIMDRVQR